jgi:glycosyltransferase involved in cell wall biosynthesis
MLRRAVIDSRAWREGRRYSGGDTWRRLADRRVTQIAILYPTDPAAAVPSGIDSFIRDLLRFAPADLAYTLIGASSDPVARPLFERRRVEQGGRAFDHVAVARLDASGKRSAMPLTLRYLAGLARFAVSGGLRPFRVFDCHRIEPLALASHRGRACNLVLHQDMSVLRDAGSDILWSRAPGIYEALERRLLRRADGVYCVRRTAVQRYTGLYPELASRFHFIPTCVDTGLFAPPSDRSGSREELRRRLAIPDGRRVLVFVGRFDRQKDPLLLLTAFARAARAAADLHLIMVGDGDLRPDVEALIAREGLSDRVTLTGVQPPKAIAAILRGADLFVLASAYEGMPIAVLEALATGLPVVSTDVGEIAQVVVEGRHGAIASDRSAEALAAATLRALAAAPAMRGAPCQEAAAPFQPARALSDIYAAHERQAGLRAA